MSDADKYRQAADLFEAGDHEGARKMFLELYDLAKTDRVKVMSAAALMSCLNPINDHAKMLEITEAGASLAQRANMKSEAALLKSRQAVTLLQKLIALMHKMRNLRLPSGWLEFALERDRAEYMALQDRVAQVREEADRLFKEAKQLAPSDDLQIAYHLLIDEAQAKGDDLGLQRLAFRKPPRWFKLFRRWSFDSRKEKLEFYAEMTAVRGLYLDAARMSVASGDETGPAYCFYQLAIAYRSMLMFWQARWYLMRAKWVAKKHGVRRILENIEKVMEDFKMKKISGEEVDYHGLDQ